MDNEAFIARLNAIRNINRCNPSHINKDLYRIVVSQPALIAGYEKIKSNKGATTIAKDDLSLDGFGARRFNLLRQSLLDESWQPRPARRIMIPKLGKTTMRPLGIQGPQEKIVQAALLLVLEAVYEPIFSSQSFGFRPGMNAHHALKDIESKYDGLSYALEGDIKGMYDNVNQHTLINLISRKIVDARLISLIWKLVRAGYMEDYKLYKPGLGIPQGSIVSPMFANIYLHELDMFMTLFTLPRDETRSKRRTSISKYYKNEIKKLGNKVNKMAVGPVRDGLVKELKVLKHKNIMAKTYKDPHNRVYYHRYADDFIIGIAGSEDFSLNIKEQVRSKLNELGLQLSLDKTKLTFLRKGKARFLAYDIYISSSKKITTVHSKGKSPFLKGTTGWFVYLEAPVSSMIDKLFIKDFCDRRGFPTPKRIWSIMPDHQIVDAYNVTFAGILSYYSGACHRHMLSRLNYIFRYSCAMTIATKHRSSINKVFQQYGKSITVVYGISGEKQISFKQHNVFKEKDKKWQLGKDLPDPYRQIAFKLTKTKLFSVCCICGECNVEMHHIRHVRKVKFDSFNALLGIINKKQIPVCGTCHGKIHTGKYDGISLSELAYPELAKS